jgi:hypothetical protein
MCVFVLCVLFLEAPRTQDGTNNTEHKRQTDRLTNTHTHTHTHLEEALDPRGIEVACENADLIRPSNRLLSSSLNSCLRPCV